MPKLKTRVGVKKAKGTSKSFSKGSVRGGRNRPSITRSTSFARSINTDKSNFEEESEQE